MNNWKQEKIEEFRKKFGSYELRYVEHGKESVKRIMGTAIIQDWLLTALSEAEERVVEDYTNWLLKHHYVDSDVYTEEPKAIERYLSSLNKDNE